MDPAFRVHIATQDDDIAACLALRRRIFVDEQAIPESLDSDGLDDDAVHVIVRRDQDMAATGRLVCAGNHGVLARIAVDAAFRGQGLGRAVVLHLEDAARGRGLRSLSLHPHAYLERFYRRLGYRTVPGTSVVGEHRLITMEKELDRAAPKDPV